MDPEDPGPGRRGLWGETFWCGNCGRKTRRADGCPHCGPDGWDKNPRRSPGQRDAALRTPPGTSSPGPGGLSEGTDRPSMPAVRSLLSWLRRLWGDDRGR
jgi:hypothetical protein